MPVDQACCVCVCTPVTKDLLFVHAGEGGTCILPHSTKLWMQVGGKHGRMLLYLQSVPGHLESAAGLTT